MKGLCRILVLNLLAAGAGFAAQNPAMQTGNGRGLNGSVGRAVRKMVKAQSADTMNVDTSEQLEKSREAGLLTDWHLDGHYGHGGAEEFGHRFAPEKMIAKGNSRHFERSRYEMVFPEGIFVLPQELATLKGVFYAKSNTYLTNGGEWNVYLESNAQTVVFVDGRRVVTNSGSATTGVLRSKIHLESGYHTVMVKFLAEAAPFRVAILPPNSGSRRKNNTPYLQAVPASEDMMAEVRH